MGYGEALAALAEETAREIAAIEATARRTGAELLEATRRELDAAGARVLEETRAALERDAIRERGRARAAAGQALLGARRRWLEEVRRAAPARLLALDDDTLVARLTDELLAITGDADALTVRVDPGREDALRRHLAERHPALAARATVSPAPAPRGGACILLGRHELDNTLLGRLARAWPRIEGEIAALLFGEHDAEP